MDIFQKVTALLTKRQKIDKEIATLQKSCKHGKQSVKQIRERLDSTSPVIRYTCDECLIVLGYPSDKDKQNFFRE